MEKYQHLRTSQTDMNCVLSPLIQYKTIISLSDIAIIPKQIGQYFQQFKFFAFNRTTDYPDRVIYYYKGQNKYRPINDTNFQPMGDMMEVLEYTLITNFNKYKSLITPEVYNETNTVLLNKLKDITIKEFLELKYYDSEDLIKMLSEEFLNKK